MVATRITAIVTLVVVLAAVTGFAVAPVAADGGDVEDPSDDSETDEDDLRGGDGEGGESNDSETDEDTGGDYAMGYSAEELDQPLEGSDHADIKTVEIYSDHAVLTVVSDRAVTVVQPQSQYDEIGDFEHREIRMERNTIPSGETEVHVPLTGDSVFVTIDGAVVQLSGEQGPHRGLIQHLDPTPALLLGAAAGLFAAVYVAYRKTKKQLDEPVKARDVWKR